MVLRLNPNQDPIIVSNATETTDGAMSAADKVKLDGLSGSTPLLSWIGGVQTWADLYAAIEAAGDQGVIVSVFANLTIPAGNWELSEVTWIGQAIAGGLFPRVTFSANALITAGSLGRITAQMIYIDIAGKILNNGKELTVFVSNNSVLSFYDVVASALTSLELYALGASYIFGYSVTPSFALAGGSVGVLSASAGSTIGSVAALVTGGASVSAVYDATSSLVAPNLLWASGIPTFTGTNLDSSPLSVVRIAEGAVEAYTVGQISTAAGKQVKTFVAGSDPALITCTILDDAADGEPTRCAEIVGQAVYIKSDGTGTIAHGAGVDPSATIDGKVMSGIGVLGYNVGADVAATLDALVEVL